MIISVTLWWWWWLGLENAFQNVGQMNRTIAEWIPEGDDWLHWFIQFWSSIEFLLVIIWLFQNVWLQFNDSPELITVGDLSRRWLNRSFVLDRNRRTIDFSCCWVNDDLIYLQWENFLFLFLSFFLSSFFFVFFSCFFSFCWAIYSFIFLSFLLFFLFLTVVRIIFCEIGVPLTREPFFSFWTEERNNIRLVV